MLVTTIMDKTLDMVISHCIVNLLAVSMVTNSGHHMVNAITEMIGERHHIVMMNVSDHHIMGLVRDMAISDRIVNSLVAITATSSDHHMDQIIVTMIGERHHITAVILVHRIMTQDNDGQTLDHHIDLQITIAVPTSDDDLHQDTTMKIDEDRQTLLIAESNLAHLIRGRDLDMMTAGQRAHLQAATNIRSPDLDLHQNAVTMNAEAFHLNGVKTLEGNTRNKADVPMISGHRVNSHAVKIVPNLALLGVQNVIQIDEVRRHVDLNIEKIPVRLHEDSTRLISGTFLHLTLESEKNL